MPRISRALRSATVRTSILASLIASGGTLLLSLSAARSSSIDELGHFSLGLAGVLLISGLGRAAISEPLSTFLPSRREIFTAGFRAVSIGLLVAPVLVLVGWVLDSKYLIAVAIAAPSLTLFEHNRFSYMAILGNKRAITIETIRFCIVAIVAVGSQIKLLNAFEAFVLWLVASGLLATLASWSERTPWRKHLERPSRQTSVLFSVEYLLGQGAIQSTTLLVAGVAGPIVNGTLRAGGTLLGPVSMLVTAVSSLMVPYLSRGENPQFRVRRALQLAILMAVAVGGGVLVLTLIPDSMGRSLLGESWAVARPIVPILGLDLIATAISLPAVAGHKSQRAAERMVIIRLCLAIIRVFGVVSGAYLAGAWGAGMGGLASAMIAAMVWWVSYLTGSNRTDVESPPPGSDANAL